MARIIKFMSNDSSSYQTSYSSPPTSFIYYGPKQSNDFSPYLVPLFFALGAAFLIVAYFTFVKKYYLSPNNQARPVPQILGEDHGREIDHHIWHITTVGFEQSVVDTIPVFIYGKNEGLIEGTMCSICLSEFQGDETIRRLPKCSHAFHVPCIDTWLRSHKNCPTCRAPAAIESAANALNNGWESNSNHLTPVEETTNENFRDRDGVECYQRPLQVGRSENFGALRRENDQIEETVSKKSTCLGKKSCGFRVFSDLGRCREKGETEPEQVRRSISMDPSSSVYLAMSNIHEMELEHAHLLKGKVVKSEISDNGVNATSKISKLMKTSSLRISLRKGPVLMKRSFSSSKN